MPTFISKANEFRLGLTPAGRPLRDTNNTVVGFEEGTEIMFRRGRYDANAIEARRLGYENTDALVHAITHNYNGSPRRTFGTEFWELGNEPGAMQPPTDKLLADIGDAAVRRNEKGLLKIVEQEEATHQREAVLISAKSALAALGNTDVGKRRPGRPHIVKPEGDPEAD